MAKGDEVVHAVRKTPKKIIVKQKPQPKKNFKNGGKKFKPAKFVGGGKNRGISAGGSLGSGVKMVSAPATLGYASSSYMSMKSMGAGKYKGGIRVRGRDYFNQIAVPTSAPTGTTLLNLPLNPTLLQGTRLAELAGLYEKYRFNKFSIICTPNTATTVGGAYGMSYDRDPSDPTPSPNLQGVRQFMAMPGAVEASHWVPSRLDCPLMEPVTDFFTNAIAGSDERLVDQGQFYIFELNGTIATGVVMNLLIEYDLTLYIPCFDQQEIGVMFEKNVAGTTPAAMSIPSNLTKGAWGQLPLVAAASVAVLGDEKAFQRVTDGLGNLGVKMPPGLWQIIQTFRQYGPNVATSGIANWLQPTFEAAEPSEQSYYQYQDISGDFSPLPVAVGLFKYPITTVANVLIPPGGGTLFGNFVSSYTQTAAATQNELLVGFFPGCGSITPDLELTMTRPGKYGNVVREKYRQKKLGVNLEKTEVSAPPQQIPHTRSVDDIERLTKRLDEMRLLRVKRAFQNKAELSYRAENAPVDFAKEKEVNRVARDNLEIWGNPARVDERPRDHGHDSDDDSVNTDDLIRAILDEDRLEGVYGV